MIVPVRGARGEGGTGLEDVNVERAPSGLKRGFGGPSVLDAPLIDDDRHPASGALQENFRTGPHDDYLVRPLGADLGADQGAEFVGGE